ncbi:MAG: fibronectin type III domain-containing protein [Thermoplasmatota archaeon]
MRTRTLFIVLILMLAPLMVSTPFTEDSRAEQGPTDGGGYRYTDGNEPEPTIEADYIDVKMDPEAEGLDTSQYNALIKKDLGFSFKYYGNTYSSIYISTYGAMSFVEDNENTFRDYYNYRIPSTGGPKGLMAVYWTWDSAQSNQKDRLFILRTEIDGEKVFIVEWNTGRGAKFEAMLYQGGMIKYQYFSGQSSYVLGSYCTIGIESPDSTTGVPYINYQYTSTPKFNTPFAVAFTKDNVETKGISLKNGDGPGDRIYAGSKPYIFEVQIFHSSNRDSILNCVLILGSLYDQERIKLIYHHKNGTFRQINGFQHADLLSEESGSRNLNSNNIAVTFHVDFRIQYPSEDNRNVSGRASGMSAIPSEIDAGELYSVENDLEWDPSDLRVKKVTGETEYLRDGDYVAGSESIMFSGFRIFYERSDIQPPPTIISLNITDNFGLKKVAYIPQGESLSATWTVVDETAVMNFDFEVSGLSYQYLLGDPFSFTLKIDSTPPSQIESENMQIFQDELDGSNEPYIDSTDTYIDNDDNFYVKWDKISDGESGIGGYIVEVDGGDLQLRKFVENTEEGSNMSVHIGSDYSERVPEGEYQVSVRAVDLVGNVGGPVSKNLVVDTTGPTFDLLDPEPGEWKMSRKPAITILVEDDLTPVDGRTLFYQVSTNGGITYSEWSSMLYYGREDRSVEIEVRPDLAEGRNNMVKVRGEDLAGSGLTTSEEFPIWVDNRPPEIYMVEPAVDENRTTVEWLKDVNRPIKISMHDWKGAGIDPNRISYRISLNGGEDFSADIPLNGEPFNNSKGFSEYTFSIQKDWSEGSDNLLVVDAYDLVGRNMTAVFRIKVDVTPEVEVISPKEYGGHYDNRSILFKVDVVDIDGEDDIEVVWMSNLDGPIGFESEVETTLSAGDHIITLTVRDGVHTIKRSIPLKVQSARLLDPAFRDSDSDKMNDSYEEIHGLDPFKDDADEDLDGDGYSNIEEFYAGTDPADRSDYPGSELESSSISMAPIVILLIAFLVIGAFGFLLVKQIRKQQLIQYQRMPPMPLQQRLPSTGSPELPALPPSRQPSDQ